MTHPSSFSRRAGSALTYAALVLIACVGVWGCGRKPTEAATQERARALETRCVQLEKDYRLAAEDRNKARRDLTEARGLIATQGELLRELEGLKETLQSALAGQEHYRKLASLRTQERDDLRNQLAMRMTEREQLTARCEKLRKGLQSLLQDDGLPGAAPAALGSE